MTKGNLIAKSKKQLYSMGRNNNDNIHVFFMSTKVTKTNKNTKHKKLLFTMV